MKNLFIYILLLVSISVTAQSRINAPKTDSSIVDNTTFLIKQNGNKAYAIRFDSIRSTLKNYFDGIYAGGGPADNLGNHIATQDLNMGLFDINIYNPDANDTQIDYWNFSTINGNFILNGLGGALGSTTPAFGIDANTFALNAPATSIADVALDAKNLVTYESLQDYVTNNAGGGSVSLPTNQIGYGNGTGIISASDFTWNPTTKVFILGLDGSADDKATIMAGGVSLAFHDADGELVTNSDVRASGYIVDGGVGLNLLKDDGMVLPISTFDPQSRSLSLGGVGNTELTLSGEGGNTVTLPSGSADGYIEDVSLIGTDLTFSTVGTGAYEGVVSLAPLFPSTTDILASVPTNVYFHEGLDNNIYYDAIFSSGDNGLVSHTNIEIVASDTLGKTFQRRFNWGNETLTGKTIKNIKINLLDQFSNVQESKNVILTYLDDSRQPVSMTGCNIGDSLTGNGTITTTIVDDFSFNSNPVTMYGSFGVDPYKNEGRAGWTFNHFATSVDSPLITGGVIDIPAYRAAIGAVNPLDFVTIQLGTNDCFSYTVYNDATITAIIDNAKLIIDGFVADGTKVVMVVLPTFDSNTKDGWGSNYSGLNSKVSFQKNILKLRKAMVSEFDNAAYHKAVTVNAGASYFLDRYYGFPIGAIPLATRIGGSYTGHTNALHPKTEGYRQVGDGIFAQLVNDLIVATTVTNPTVDYGIEQITNGDFAGGLTGWDTGTSANWEVFNGRLQVTETDTQSIIQNVGTNTTVYRVQMDAFKDGGSYKLRDGSGRDYLIQDGKNVWFTTLDAGNFNIRVTINKPNAWFDNIKVEEVIQINEIGDDLILNGDFANGSTDWVRGGASGTTGWEIGTDASATLTAVTKYTNLSQNNMDKGMFQRLSFDMPSNNEELSLYYVNGAIIPFTNSFVGTNVVDFYATSSNLFFYQRDAEVTLDNISIKLLDVWKVGENVWFNSTFDHDKNMEGIDGTTKSVANGEFVWNTTGIANVYQNVLLQGYQYEITYTITEYTSGEVFMSTVETDLPVRTSTGTFTDIISHTTTNPALFFESGSGGFVGKIDNVTVIKL